MKNRQDGFATVFVLMLAAALLVLIGIATHFMYAANDQNRRERQNIIQRAGVLNQHMPAPTVGKNH